MFASANVGSTINVIALGRTTRVVYDATGNTRGEREEQKINFATRANPIEIVSALCVNETRCVCFSLFVVSCFFPPPSLFYLGSHRRHGLFILRARVMPRLKKVRTPNERESANETHLH